MRSIGTIFLVAIVLLAGCTTEMPLSEKENRVAALNQELSPLSADPILWTDAELIELDKLFANRTVVGLGEATHGTSEFFEAKNRIFQYLVENHGFRVIAIEADFGESILINQAVLNSDKSQITALMLEKMHFWTWQTNEVRELLYWMCDYNLGKSDEEKVQYWGVDCQFNTFHPGMVRDALERTDVSFLPFADSLLQVAETMSANNFTGYSPSFLAGFLETVDALKDSLTHHEAELLTVWSLKEFEVTMQLLELVRQVSEVRVNAVNGTSAKNYRDEYMAENTLWLRQHINGAKVVLWAHNAHISNYAPFGSLGYHLKSTMPEDFVTFGLLFSRGSFMAKTVVGNQVLALEQQQLESEPKVGSLNELLAKAEEKTFFVAMSDLDKHGSWKAAFGSGMTFIQIGAVYNRIPNANYAPFSPVLFDGLIYIDRSSASAIIN